MKGPGMKGPSLKGPASKVPGYERSGVLKVRRRQVQMKRVEWNHKVLILLGLDENANGPYLTFDPKFVRLLLLQGRLLNTSSFSVIVLE